MTDLRPILNLAGSIMVITAAFNVSPRFGVFVGGVVLLWTWKNLRQ